MIEPINRFVNREDLDKLSNILTRLENKKVFLRENITYQDIFDYLRINKIVFVSIKPIDDWEEYSYEILYADVMSPFFIGTPYGFYIGSYEDCEVSILEQIIKQFS